MANLVNKKTFAVTEDDGEVKEDRIKICYVAKPKADFCLRLLLYFNALKGFVNAFS